MSEYEGKLFSILGDSISTLEGYSVPKYAEFYEGFRKIEAGIFVSGDTWWGQVINALGGTLLVNNSFSGSTVIDIPAFLVSSSSCSDERTSSLHRGDNMPDVIMVFMGTNDWGSGVKLKPENESEEGNLGIFSCAYESMLEKLSKNYPSAELWCFTLPISQSKRYPQFEFPYKYGGKHIRKYCDVIRECASRCGARIIELYNYGEPHDTIDYFHPSREGMVTISNKILEQIKGDKNDN